MSENIKRFFRGFTYMGVILFSGFIVFKYFTLKNQTTKIINLLHQQIITRDTIIKSKDTTIKIYQKKYNKLVKVYESTKISKDYILRNNKVLFDTIKKRNEKILAIKNTFLSFVPKHGTVTKLVSVDKADTVFTFISYYPKKENYMAKFEGKVNLNTKMVGENWDFQKFKLGIVLTQKENGGWDYYLDAPEYAIISDVKINSFKQVEGLKPLKKVDFLLGMGVRSGVRNFDKLDNKSLTLTGGVKLKNDHIITLDYNTKNYVGLGYMIKIK